MRTIAVMNAKGGACKTTTTINVAAALGELGRKVLVIDLDPQASASSWLGIKDGGKGLLEAITANANLVDLVRDSPASNVQVIPSSMWLAGIEKAMVGEVGSETVLRTKIGSLPTNWDYVICDCPPAIGFMSLSALVGCHEILVPVEATVMALSGLATLVQTVDRVRQRLNPDLSFAGVLACRVVARRRLSQDVIASLRKTFGKDVLETVIRESVRLAEAPSFGKPITLYDPKGSGSEDYRAVAKELESKYNKSIQKMKRFPLN